MTNVDRIIMCEAEADLHESKASELRWEAARLIAAELDAGKTQRELAGEIGKSAMHVNYMARVWREHGVNHGVQERSFDSYYQEVKRRQPKDEPEASADSSEFRSRSSRPISDAGDSLPVRLEQLGFGGTPKEDPDKVWRMHLEGLYLTFESMETVTWSHPEASVQQKRETSQQLRNLAEKIEKLAVQVERSS